MRHLHLYFPPYIILLNAIAFIWVLTPNPEKTFGSGQGVYEKKKTSLIG